MSVPQPKFLLSILSASAVVLGAWLYIAKNSQGGADEKVAELQQEIVGLKREVTELRDHNARLKALAAADAPVEFPLDLLRFVEGTLGFEFDQRPLAFRRSEEMLEEAASQFWLANIGEEALLARNFSLEALGVLPPMSDLQNILTKQSYGFRMAVYDPSSAEILLDLRYDEENVHHQAQLAHAAALALLAQMREPWVLTHNDDVRTAETAMLYAVASQATQTFYARKSREAGVPLQSARPVTREEAQASDLFSNLLAKFFTEQAQGFADRNPRFFEQETALTAQTILTGNPEFSEDQDSEPVTISENEGDDKTTLLQTQLGLLPVLAVVVDEPAHAQLTQGFLRDRLSIRDAGAGSLVTEWQIEWRDAATAEFFLSKLTKKPSLQVTQQGSTTTLSAEYRDEEP